MDRIQMLSCSQYSAKAWSWEIWKLHIHVKIPCGLKWFSLTHWNKFRREFASHQEMMEQFQQFFTENNKILAKIIQIRKNKHLDVRGFTAFNRSWIPVGEKYFKGWASDVRSSGASVWPIGSVLFVRISRHFYPLKISDMSSHFENSNRRLTATVYRDSKTHVFDRHRDSKGNPVPISVWILFGPASKQDLPTDAIR